jgi:hypothetical protein
VFLPDFIEFSVQTLARPAKALYFSDSHSSNILSKQKNPSRMKRRIRKIVNFFAFNLLFFALYLNFIHKDSGAVVPVPIQTNAAAATVSGTVPVQDADKYLNAKASTSIQPAIDKAGQENELKLSIN